MAGLALAALLVASVGAQVPPARSSAAAAHLISLDTLQKKTGEPHVRVIDVRDKADFDKGHVPGAVWADLKSAQQLSASEKGLGDRDAWAKWLEPLGIGTDSEVYIYDSQRQLSAARTWWLLTYLGVKKVGLVNGGWLLWVNEGRPVSTEATHVAPRVFPVNFQTARLASRDDVKKSLLASEKIVDARSKSEYSGEEARAKRGGHIPSACHLEWNTLVDPEGRFIDTALIHSKLASLGIDRNHPVVTHCQSGGRASVNAFVLERLGVPTRNYYLGWSDWGNAESTPVEKGQSPNPTPAP